MKTFFIAVIASVLLGPISASAEKPNIIMIMADDLGWGDVEYSQDRAPGDSYDGNLILKTPNLADMADAGLKFNRFYAASPVCSPTRASTLTGRHGRRHNIDGPLFDGDDGKIRNRDITVAELAKIQGYTTGHFGKWHVGSLTKHTYDMRRGRTGNSRHYSAPWNNGYDTSFASENWMPTYDPYSHFPIKNAEQAGYFVGPSDTALTNRIPNDSRVNDKHESEIIADQALDFIQQSNVAGQPFMTTVWFSTPHIPLIETPDTGYDGLGLSNSRRKYYEAISKMDEQIGRIRQELTNLGIADNTLLVFTSDNGPDSLSIGSNGGLSGEKRQLAEGGLRVPAILEWQGRIAPGTSTNAMATTSDLVPTFLDIWGDSMPDDRPLDGASIRPLLDTGAQSRSSDYRFFSRYTTERMAMDNTYKLISTNNGSTFELFDLINDPTEQTNLLSGSPSAVILQKRDNLLSELNNWLASADASRVGDDYTTQIAGSSNNVVIKADTELSLALEQIGTDSFDAPIYEDKYQIVEGNFEDSAKATVFLERQYATIDSPLQVDSDGSAATYNSNSLPEGHTIAAGEIVHSYLVHFDPDVATGQESIQIDLTFEDPILGVIGRSDRLDGSDFLAFAEPVFDTGNDPFTPGRGMLFGESSDGGWTVGPDGRTISISMLASSSGYDQLRILTQATRNELVWIGDDTGVWSPSGGSDWDSGNDNLGDTEFVAIRHVIFGDSAEIYNVSIASPVSPASVTFQNTLGVNYVLTGSPISGVGDLKVEGGGHVTLANGPNSYSGPTRIDSGVLSLAGEAAIVASSSIHVATGGTLDVTERIDGTYMLTNQTLTIDGQVTGDLVASGSSLLHVNSLTAISGDMTLQNGTEARGLGRIMGSVTAESGSKLRVGGEGDINGIIPVAQVTSSENFQEYPVGTVFTNNALTGSPSMPGWHFVDDGGSGEVTFVLSNEAGNILLQQTDPMFPEDNRGARAISPLKSDGTFDTITVQMRSDETGGFVDRVVYFAYEDDDNFSYAIVRNNGTASFGDVENGVHAINIPSSTDFGNFSPSFSEFIVTHDANLGRVTLEVNGTTLYNVVDSRFAGGATGRVGIGTGNDAASFDDLIVTTETQPDIGASELIIDGSYVQQMGATLILDIYNPQTFERLKILGDFQAGGTLEVAYVSGSPLPKLGDKFDILDFDTGAGTFDTYDLPSLPQGLAWNVADLLTTGELEIVVDLDFDNDGDVDGIDFLMIQRTNPTLISEWQNQLSSRSNIASSATVPEPSTQFAAIFFFLIIVMSFRKSELTT